MNFVEDVIINIDQLESRDRTSVKKIAAQNNKGCGCFCKNKNPKIQKVSRLCLQLFRQRLSNKSVKAYATMPIGIMGRKRLALVD